MGRTGLAARTRRWACGGSLIAALAVCGTAEAAPSLSKLGDFAEPVFAAGAPGDGARVFVVERKGKILVANGAATQTFLDLTSETFSEGSERGLLSLAFSPDYATSGRFFVYLTVAGGDIQVREYRRGGSPDVADPASGRVLLTVPHREAENHNGGQLQWGPDGLLWLGTGDGGSGDDAFRHAQDPASLLGKLIKLDVNTGAATIASVGLRNPWRFSFDRANGQIVIADVGQGAREEINVGLASNYGWPCREGAIAGPRQDATCASGTAGPVLDKTHDGDGFCSITGGYVVRDPGLPTLNGRYIYGDYCATGLRSVDLGNPRSDAALGLSVQGLSSFGEDACGRIFVVSLNGPVWRLVDGAPSACDLGSPPATVVPDTRACSLALRATGVRSVRKYRRLTVALRTDEGCRATVKASIKGIAQFRSTKTSLTAGKRAVVRVKLTARGVRAVRSALRRKASLRVAVRVTAVDAVGNVRTLSRAVKIRG
ncbi:PQQ-dependent sugar dehydrogenase [Solirubrobacter phytolaccae]|uniref:PQQ-dependent sugar dehydrogenase n=1 Tax=Solirubrobacter phytolaccae TaxID=1404360 RepID=A0A9X3SIA6_9ACTN|nr:PQQ-dependent sugar dehydrogenase [Solirubrobacter phytolaccae]MDA0184097.1 PQQ-dependent sugar dehydrogenase [Solirubrobacter phytolaccae]